MRDALFTLAMLVVFLANLLSMGEWYRFASDRNLSDRLFLLVLSALLVAGTGLDVALAIWWLS
jgi:cbb3-type cytochrome oxidase subunit 3